MADRGDRLLLLSLGGCTAAVSAVAALGRGVDAVMTPIPFGDTAEFTSSSDTGALVILSDAGRCEGTNRSGDTLTFDDPISDVPTDADGQSLEFARTFETDNGETYSVMCDSKDARPAEAEITILRLPTFPFEIAGILGAIGGGLVLGLLLLVLGPISLIVDSSGGGTGNGVIKLMAPVAAGRVFQARTMRDNIDPAGRPADHG